MTAAPESPTEDAVQRIAAGYAVSGPALELGAVVVGATPHASAQVRVPLSMLTRHGLITGATGTGKTKTLQVIAEQLSSAGVPVVLADVKGDLSGLATAGTSGDRVVTRAAQTGDDWTLELAGVHVVRPLGGLGTHMAADHRGLFGTRRHRRAEQLHRGHCLPGCARHAPRSRQRAGEPTCESRVRM